MILYHGSYVEIRQPDLKHSRARVDFGKGFYTTPIYEQAEKWCLRFKRRQQSGIISVYDCDAHSFSSLKVMQFSDQQAAVCEE